RTNRLKVRTKHELINLSTNSVRGLVVSKTFKWYRRHSNDVNAESRTQQKGIATKRSRKSQRLWFYLAPLAPFCSRSLSFALLPVFAITYSVHSGLSLSYENTSRQSQHAVGLQTLTVSSA